MEKPERIGETANRLLRMGATNKEALQGVLKVHPTAKTTMKCIRWYRHRLTSDFEDVPYARDAPGLTSDNNGASSQSAFSPAREAPPVSADTRADALDLLRKLLLRWRTNEQAILEVKRSYPSAGIRPEDVRTVRSELGRSGQYVPTSAQARRAQIGEPRATDPAPPAWIAKDLFG